MSSINIKIDKRTRAIEFKIDDRVITDEMSEKVTEICNWLIIDSNKFEDEKVFNMIFQYIKAYKRLLYSQISNVVYACFNEHTPEEASNKLGTMISNIEKIVAYTGTQQYKDKKEKTKRPEERAAYEDTEKALIKIWDHVNLAQTQYSGLKQTDEEYKRKFDKSITPFKEELVRDMNAQLLTMVSIFTALAFLVFGGISSLGSIFSNHELPLLKVIIIGCVWGICLLNLIFVFLFCIGKMTGLNFKSNREPDANIVQKYPIVWWSDLIILTILFGTLWTYYIRKEKMDSWFIAWCRSFRQGVVWFGYGVIAIVFIAVSIVLFKLSWKKGE
ncbi:MAG: hypothetical protein HFG41_11295 [Coprococcus sp.]|nr:hypothetical protein [Coprococcus sp.]